MKRQYVKDLRDAEGADDVFVVGNKDEISKYRNGWMFKIDVADKTGTISVKFWGSEDKDAVAAIHDAVECGKLVRIAGYVKTDPKWGRSIHVNPEQGAIERAAPGDTDPSEFKIRPPVDAGRMAETMRAEAERLRDPDIRRLVMAFFDDKEFMRRYAACPAAKSYHHNYEGGLLQHVLSMISVARHMASWYEPELDEDLLVAGCILHDIGKIHEYEPGVVIKFTEKGSLLGHIVMGARMVADKADGLEGFPGELADKLVHMVLSHHGTRGFGSPVEPQFAEAVALHMIDNCDAQVKHALQTVQDGRQIRGTG